MKIFLIILILLFPEISYGDKHIYIYDFLSIILLFGIVTSSKYPKSMIILLLFFLALITISLFFSYKNNILDNSIFHYIRYLEYIIFILYISKLSLEKNILIVKIVFFYIIIIGFLQYFSLDSIYLTSLEKNNFTFNENNLRIISIFQHPNIYALYIVLSSMLLLFIYEKKIIYNFIILISVSSLILTNSRGVLLLSFLLIIYYLLAQFNKKSFLLLFFISIILFSIYSFIDLDLLLNKFRLNIDIENNSSVFLRLRLWISAINISFENYFLPNGINAFRFLTDVTIWGNFGNGTEEYKTHANSFLLEHLVDDGIVLLLFIYFIFYKIIMKKQNNIYYFVFSYILLLSSLYDDLIHEPIMILNLLILLKLFTKLRSSIV